MALNQGFFAFFSDSGGQAAITDALYFLTITASLCLFLFIFATQYGNSVNSSIQDRYLEEYEASALKTILYSSTPRNPSADLTSKELDFLLAAVKEDYADDQNLDETQITLKNNIQAIMNSKSDSFDYIFYIYSSEMQTNRFPYFLFYKSEWGETPIRGIIGGVTIEPQGHKFWFCHPETLAQIDNLLLGVAGVPPTRNRIKLMKLEPISTGEGTSYTAKGFTAEAYLKMWPSTSINPDAFLRLGCCEAGTPNCFAGSGAAVPNP